MIDYKRLCTDMVQEVEAIPPVVIDIIGGVKLYTSDCVIVLAARPGVGKTNTACKVAAQYAQRGQKVLFYSGEMPARMIAHRLYNIFGCCDTELNNIICIDSMTGVAEIATATAEVKPDLLIIDQISLLSPPRYIYGEMANTIAAGENMKLLITLQRQAKIPVVVLSQINRKSDDKKSLDLERLALSDSIGQFATVVVGIEKMTDSRADFAYKYTILKSRYGANKWEYIDEYDKIPGWVKQCEFDT